MKNLEKPQKGEYFIIEYGMKKKIKHTVLIIEDTKLEFPNWRKHHFKCMLDNKTKALVDGNCFIEKISTELSKHPNG